MLRDGGNHREILTFFTLRSLALGLTRLFAEPNLTQNRDLCCCHCERGR